MGCPRSVPSEFDSPLGFRLRLADPVGFPRYALAVAKRRPYPGARAGASHDLERGRLGYGIPFLEFQHG